PIWGCYTSTFPPNKLRDDYHATTSITGGKSLAIIRSLDPEGSSVPSGVAEPRDDGLADSVFGLNLLTCPPFKRYVISSDDSYHSDSHSEVNFFARSTVPDTPVSKDKVRSENLETFGDSASADEANVNAASSLKLNEPTTSSDSFYASQDLGSETLSNIYIPKWKVKNDSVLDNSTTDVFGRGSKDASETYVGTKNRLEDKCVEQTTLFSKKDAEVAHLRSLLSLKETVVAEAIHLHSQLSVVEAADAAKSIELGDLKERNFALEGHKDALSEKVATLESLTASKETELASLTARVAQLTSDLSGFQLSRDKLSFKVAFLESERDMLADQAIDCAVNKDIQDGLKLGVDLGNAGRDLSVIEDYDPSAEAKYIDAENALGTVDFYLLSELTSKKDANMVDLMDYLHLEGPLAKIPRAKDLQPSSEQLMLPLHRPEDNCFRDLIWSFPLRFELASIFRMACLIALVDEIHRPVTRHPQQPLTPITAPWPFYKWGIDIAGLFPEGLGKVKFLIVVMDYFTKWIEAKAVATITGGQVKKFVWDNIVCRFGIPGEIISDNGKQFADNPFKDWCDKLNITQHFASVKHPQSNRLVERANKSLGEGIKARLGKGNKNWVEKLPHVLWAHRTMVKSSHGDTPFSLTYGTEAVIPAEIRMPTYRTTAVDVVNNDKELRLNLVLLEERRDLAAINEARSKSKMTKYYNSRVRGVSFQPGDFVYRSNDASHTAAGGKLGPKWEGPYEVTDALRNGAYKLRSMDGRMLPRTWNVANLKRCYL
nr:reverse transcriptase domain-containing protein [Tanacetum cinerariifolium]